MPNCASKKRMMLYFGSFNPIHRGHTALTEYVLDGGLCDEVALIVSPQSPYKKQADLASELDRLEWAEIACKATKYPDRIRPSAVEMLLPKPSYTIDTLRFLEEQCGAEMEFSILMGEDQLVGLSGWKEADEVLKYPIFVYPRSGSEQPTVWPQGQLTLLKDAPRWDISATEIRRRIECGEDTSEWLNPEVSASILRKGLWSPTMRLAALNVRLEENPDEVESLLERGKLHYRLNRWGEALNDFNRALQVDPAREEARQFADMVREILEFRYKDIYNP